MYVKINKEFLDEVGAFVMEVEPRPSDSYKEGVRRMMERGKW